MADLGLEIQANYSKTPSYIKRLYQAHETSDVTTNDNNSPHVHPRNTIVKKSHIAELWDRCTKALIQTIDKTIKVLRRLLSGFMLLLLIWGLARANAIEFRWPSCTGKQEIMIFFSLSLLCL